MHDLRYREALSRLYLSPKKKQISKWKNPVFLLEHSLEDIAVWMAGAQQFKVQLLVDAPG